MTMPDRIEGSKSSQHGLVVPKTVIVEVGSGVEALSVVAVFVYPLEVTLISRPEGVVGVGFSHLSLVICEHDGAA